MSFIQIDNSTQQTVETSFNRIATTLFEDYCLNVNEVRYKLVDIEFYFHGKDTSHHQDTFTHKHIQQLTNGKLYFHGSGIDITCGGENGYGGILIRGIAKQPFSKVTYIQGPLTVACELMKNLNNLFDNIPNRICLEKTALFRLPFILPDKKYFTVSRIGLSSKVDDIDDKLKNALYRYIHTNTDYLMVLKGKENYFREWVRSGQISKTEAIKITGNIKYD